MNDETHVPNAQREQPEPDLRPMLRMRLGPTDARYGNGLVAGAKALEIFGDLETEIAIRTGGDEGLCVAYHSVEFLAPLFAGDFIEATAVVRWKGRTSRRIEAKLYKVISAEADGTGRVHDPPILAVRATATIVPGKPTRANAGQ